jgi:hypothetical protein
VVEAEDYRYSRVKVFETLVRAMEAALERRQASPSAVSRTQLAARATKGDRDRRAREDLVRATQTAKDAGLPLEP